MAAHLLRHLKDGRARGAAQLPLYGGGDQILRRSCRSQHPSLRPRIHRARRGDRRRDRQKPHPPLCGRRHGADFCRELRSAGQQLFLRCPRRGAFRRGRRRHLLFERHDGLSESHPARAPFAHARGAGRIHPPPPDAGRRVPAHPAPLPHGREDALDGKSDVRKQGGAPSRHLPRSDHGDHLQRALHHRLAARAVGAGYPRKARLGRTQTQQLQYPPIPPHAHRRAARAAEPHQALAGILPRAGVRHQLRPFGVHRPRCRASRHREPA